jgi:hypothetical protein
MMQARIAAGLEFTRTKAIEMVAKEQRTSGRLPLFLEVRLHRGGALTDEPLTASLVNVGQTGAQVRVPASRLVVGQSVVLNVNASDHNLLSIAAEVVHVAEHGAMGCLAGCQFQPQLPRRQFALLRRLAESKEPSGVNSTENPPWRP